MEFGVLGKCSLLEEKSCVSYQGDVAALGHVNTASLLLTSITPHWGMSLSVFQF